MARSLLTKEEKATSESIGEVLARGRNAKEENGESRGAGAVSSIILKKHVGKIQKLQEKLDQVRADIQSAYREAESEGLSKPELKYIVKHMLKSLSEDFKATTNIYMEMLGRLPLFHFSDGEKEEETA